MPGIGFSAEVDVTGPFFSQWQDALKGLFEDSLKEAADVGAELVRQRAPTGDRGVFKRSIIGEVRTSRRGRRYGHVRVKPSAAEGLEARQPGRRLWLERGTRHGAKLFRGHKMFLRGRQALKQREKQIAEKHAGRAVRRIR